MEGSWEKAELSLKEKKMLILENEFEVLNLFIVCCLHRSFLYRGVKFDCSVLRLLEYRKGSIKETVKCINWIINKIEIFLYLLLNTSTDVWAAKSTIIFPFLSLCDFIKNVLKNIPRICEQRKKNFFWRFQLPATLVCIIFPLFVQHVYYVSNAAVII